MTIKHIGVKSRRHDVLLIVTERYCPYIAQNVRDWIFRRAAQSAHTPGDIHEGKTALFFRKTPIGTYSMLGRLFYLSDKKDLRGQSA